ncbi:MAG TPA: hypothetical protein VLY46_02030 [Usitatibacter sp.]|nr:hypothetical protein [Usitatibacter sp.]
MSPQSATRTSPAADLLRLAIPVLVIAAAVAATLWIDRSTGFDVGSTEAPTSSSVASR